MFEITYDPTSTTAATIEDTIRNLGFGPTPSAPIAVKAKTDALEVQAQPKGAIKRGKSFTLLVGLFVPKGKQLTDVTVSVAGKGFKASTETVKAVDEKKVLEVEVSVAKSVKREVHEVVVTIKASQGEIRIKVPIEVE